MKARQFAFLGTIVLALAALSACSDAIYATIETEKKVATNTLPLTLWIQDLAVTPATNTYYVAAGGVFQGVLSGLGGTVSWSPNISDTSRPWNPPGLVCNAMALFGGVLYGGFISTSGSPSLYKSDGTFSFAPGHGTLITHPTINGKQATLLRAANTNIFMGSTPDIVNYELDYSSDGNLWTQSSLIGLPRPIVGVGFASGAYWAASGSTVYTSATLPTFSSATPSGIGTDTINGLFADSANGLVFVTTKTSGVFFTNNGGASWTRIGADTPTGSPNPSSYLTVAGPVDSGKRYYLVGSDGFGYYTLDSQLNSMSRFGDTTILLYSSSVSRILVDALTTPPYVNVLMGTNLNGLWRAVFDPTSGQVLSGINQYWIHE
jgi:hypothetical protein